MGPFPDPDPAPKERPLSPSPHFDGRLGARPVPGGVRFALDAAPGGGARLLLFPDADAALPDREIELDPQRDRHGRVWSVVVPDAGPGQCYNWVLTPPGAVARPVQHDAATVQHDCALGKIQRDAGILFDEHHRHAGVVAVPSRGSRASSDPSA